MNSVGVPTLVVVLVACGAAAVALYYVLAWRRRTSRRPARTPKGRRKLTRAEAEARRELQLRVKQIELERERRARRPVDRRSS